MHARCTTCNNHLDFKAKKGAKLKDVRCPCKGRYEPIYHAGTANDAGELRAMYRNYNNVLFYLDKKLGKYVLITPTATP